MHRLDIRVAVGGACLAVVLATAPVAALEYSEAPSMAEAAKKGELPPVAGRVSEEPEIVTPIEGVGKYGGTLRFGLRGSSDHNHILRMVGPQGLVR